MARELASWACQSISAQERWNLENFEPIINSPEYITWSASCSSDILWYVGPPRVGKTTLARYITLKPNENPHNGHQLEVVYFFCSTAISGPHRRPRNTTPDILRSFIGQLLDHDNDRITTIQDLLKSREEATKEPSPILRELLADSDTETEQLWQVLSDILGVAETLGMVFVLDDIHTISVDSRPEFLKNIRALWDSLRLLHRSPIKLLVTSRPYADISVSLEGIPRIDQDTERKRK